MLIAVKTLHHSKILSKLPAEKKRKDQSPLCSLHAICEGLRHVASPCESVCGWNWMLLFRSVQTEADQTSFTTGLPKNVWEVYSMSHRVWQKYIHFVRWQYW